MKQVQTSVSSPVILEGLNRSTSYHLCERLSGLGPLTAATFPPLTASCSLRQTMHTAGCCSLGGWMNIRL